MYSITIIIALPRPAGFRRVATVVGAVIAVLVIACLAAYLWYKSRQQRKLHNTEGIVFV
jgi:hypothetical protein